MTDGTVRPCVGGRGEYEVPEGAMLPLTLDAMWSDPEALYLHEERPICSPGDVLWVIDYKAGFDVDVFSTAMFGDEPVRSYSSNSTGNVMFIQELYNAAEQCPEFSQGMSPVVQLNGSKAIKVGKGTTRIPQFTIVKWIARPAAFNGDEAEAPAPAPAPAPKAAAPAAGSEF
jgi:hypothetical protein